MKKNFRTDPIVAIDGPAGSGKSTIAKALANQLHYIHVDTGALYRAAAYLAQQKQIDLENEEEIAQELRNSHIEFKANSNGNRIFLNGKDISDFIRTEDISKAASKVSAYPSIRATLLGLQRSLGEAGGSVLEGRDIGTVIFPDAEVKIFLTASLEERARRRTAELVARGQRATQEVVLKEILNRDKNDSSRAHAPLKKAEDALELDSTNLRIEEVLRMVENIISIKKKEMRK